MLQFICDICEEYELSDGILYDDSWRKKKKKKEKKAAGSPARKLEAGCAHMLGMKGVCGKGALLEIFNQLDEDGSNDVTEAELAEFLKKMMQQVRLDIQLTMGAISSSKNKH